MTEMLSLADLAGFDITNVKEVRFELLPPGIYGFKVVESELALAGTDQNPVARFKCEVVVCEGLVEENVDPASLVGKTHTESVFIGNEKPTEGIGRLRAFIADAGGANVGALGPVMAAFKGTMFKARIHERKKGKETYTNIRFDGMPEAPAIV